jgi:hypothetical protein
VRRRKRRWVTLSKRGEFANLVSVVLLQKLGDEPGHGLGGRFVNGRIASQRRQKKELCHRDVNPSTFAPLRWQSAEKAKRKGHEIWVMFDPRGKERETTANQMSIGRVQGRGQDNRGIVPLDEKGDVVTPVSRNMLERRNEIGCRPSEAERRELIHELGQPLSEERNVRTSERRCDGPEVGAKSVNKTTVQSNSGTVDSRGKKLEKSVKS